MKKVLIAPGHYFLSNKSQSEFYLAANIIIKTAVQSPEIEYTVICGFWDKNDIIPENIKIINIFKKSAIDITLMTRFIFLFLVAYKSFITARQIKPNVIWHLLPNGPSSFNIFIFICRLIPSLKFTRLMIGPLQVFRFTLDSLSLDNGRVNVREGGQNKLLSFLSVFGTSYLNKFDRYVFINQNAKLAYSKLVKKSSSLQYIIPSGIDVTHFKYTPTLWNNNINLLFVGNLTHNKRVDIAIRLLKVLKDSGKQCILNIVGDGAERDKLISLRDELDLKNEVIFHGFIKNTDLQSYFAQSHFLVLFSQSESFGHVLLEAFATGTPVITSNLSVFNDIVSVHNRLLLNDYSNDGIVELSRSMLKMSVKLYSSMVTSAYEQTIKFDWDNVGKKYAKIINDMIIN